MEVEIKVYIKLGEYGPGEYKSIPVPEVRVYDESHKGKCVQDFFNCINS